MNLRRAHIANNRQPKPERFAADACGLAFDRPALLDGTHPD